MAVQVLKIKENMQAVLACGVIGDFSEYNKDKKQNIEQITVNEFQNVLNCMDKDKPVNLLLDSYGGSLLDAKQIVQVMKNYQKSGGVINVTVPYIAASCATLIALSGNNLVYDPNGTFLIHSVYYDISALQTVTKLDESTLNNLKNEISELNDDLAKFYSEKSTTDVKTFRKLIAKAQDLILSPQEMKETYGFKLDIDNLFNEEGYLKLTQNKLDREISVTDQSLKEKIEQVAILGYCKDFNLSNITIKDNFTATNLINTLTIPNHNLELENNKNNMADKNLPKNQNLDDLKPEEINEEKKKLQVDIEFTEKELEAEKEKAKAQAQAEIAEKNRKVLELFAPYLNDADYLREYNACVFGMYNYEDCKQRFNDLKAKKDLATLTPTTTTDKTYNFANLQDVVYALCLKFDIDIKQTDFKKRKFSGYHSMTAEQAKIRDARIDEIFLNYANNKLARLGREPINFKFTDTDEDKSRMLFNAITQADIDNILTLFAKEVWDEDYVYPDLTKIMSMFEWVKVDDLNPVRIMKNITPIQESEDIPEFGEFPSMDVSYDYKEFKAQKQGLLLKVSFEVLLNDKFETFKGTFGRLLASVKKGFKRKFIRALLANRDQMISIQNGTSIRGVLNKVQEAYNNITDVNGNRIQVAPNFLYAPVTLGQQFQYYMNQIIDPDQPNSAIVNPWKNGNNFDLDFIIDTQLDEMVGQEVSNPKSTLKEKDATIKDDVYFIPKGAIRYLSFNKQLTPDIYTKIEDYNQGRSVAAVLIAGIAFVDPEYIVCVQGKTLLAALNKK